MKKEMNIVLSVEEKILLILLFSTVITFFSITIYNISLFCYYSFTRNSINNLNKEYNELYKIDCNIEKLNNDIEIKTNDNSKNKDDINKLEVEIKDYSNKINKFKK